MDRLRRRRTLAALAGSVLVPRAWAAASAAADKSVHDAGKRDAAPVAGDAAMIGQLLLVNLRYLEDGSRQLVLGEATRAMLSAVQPGGVVLYGANILNPPQLRSLVAGIRELLPIPPFIAVDEEGGRVSRIHGLEGTVRIAPALELARQGQDAVDRAYATIADELVTLDINMDLAPVADLGLYPELQHLGDRAFSADADLVASAVVGAVKALQARGIVSVVKHFPGHGRTRGNSHRERSAITATRAELEVDLKPFRAAFAAGVGGLMTAHVAYPALDSSALPASVSPRILQGLARMELGFDGLIVTDALEMRGLTTLRTEADAALAAFAAGADLLMGPTRPQEIHAHLAQALAAADATLLRQRLVESYGRIIAVKRRFGILTRSP
ncbi:MAG TPA: glycoside hydrolase family 3 N-terminal domain-containing protein [Casimicrobiaceae bacterium]|nr:glycoside hydrolase family 3 N-terminal domain-containing protein [Casimicrobiaceae bacterium]